MDGGRSTFLEVACADGVRETADLSVISVRGVLSPAALQFGICSPVGRMQP